MTIKMDMAYSEAQFRKKHPDSYCDSFWMASASVTEQLGAAFARAVSFRTPEEIGAQPTLRIGIAGPPDSGKSTFIKGFMGAFRSALILEENVTISEPDAIDELAGTWFSSPYERKDMKQALVSSIEAGTVMHRDAAWNNLRADSRLSNFEEIHRYGQINVELVEHPYSDAEKDYDVVILVEKKRDLSLGAIFDKSRKFGTAERELTIYAGEDFRESDKFKAFRDKMKNYSTNITAPEQGL